MIELEHLPTAQSLEKMTTGEAQEILSLWVVDQEQLCAFIGSQSVSPEFWGIAIADVINHVASMINDATGISKTEALLRLNDVIQKELANTSQVFTLDKVWTEGDTAS